MAWLRHLRGSFSPRFNTTLMVPIPILIPLFHLDLDHPYHVHLVLDYLDHDHLHLDYLDHDHLHLDYLDHDHQNLQATCSYTWGNSAIRRTGCFNYHHREQSIILMIIIFINMATIIFLIVILSTQGLSVSSHLHRGFSHIQLQGPSAQSPGNTTVTTNWHCISPIVTTYHQLLSPIIVIVSIVGYSKRSWELQALALSRSAKTWSRPSLASPPTPPSSSSACQGPARASS